MEIDKIGFIFIKNRKLLAVFSKSKYTIPGGKLEAGENDAKTLMREVREEFRAEVVPESIRYFGTFRTQAHGHLLLRTAFVFVYP